MNQSLTTPAPVSRRGMSAIFIIGVLFFIFGFITWLNSVLIPFLKLTCELSSDVQAFFVTFAFYMSYFCLGLPSSYILKRTGFKNGMALGLLVMAIGSLIFVPAAQSRSFPLFLVGLFVQGAGLTLLQTASNPYISILGPIESAARRISIMGVCNKVAGALSPLILGAIVLEGATELENKVKAAASVAEKEQLLNEMGSKIILPYIIMAVALFLLSWMIKRSSLPEIEMGGESNASETHSGRTSVLQYPHLVLGFICLFLYVGVEVMAGDAIGIYGRSMGMSLDTTRYFGSCTLAAMLAGYIIGIFAIPKYLSQQNGLKISAIAGIIFTVCAQLSTGYVSISFIALLGLANALMWPAIFPLAIDGLGKFTKTGSGLLVMGIAGGALIPLLYGTLKAKPAIGNSLAFFICMLPCYLYILYYSIFGHKVGRSTL
ncbi:sugar MFS transporter [Flavitalea sp. BT771]|uniref:sugar MFS transporter n=1 Tax=Flavitalea sp. BT771 TaxID=3063329 RepID=UPI0026E2C0B1|nr:sugar MFS transporter [Flavitalea sp. BT771]MDO6429453.1 sugar MFS transporter [Flavitalea sp. BT771]MDV6218419.1 sugar MFS transporter [Flavitalea sp. BT771]